MEKELKNMVRDLLVHVTLYQYGLYDKHKLDGELDRFFHIAEKYICNAVRRNGGICYPELLPEFGNPLEALEELRSQARNFVSLGRTGKYIADLLILSYDIYNPENKSLKKKILLFDRLIHAMHGAGAYLGEFSYEEASIFGLNIPEIKREADKIVSRILSTHSSMVYEQ